MSVLHHHLHVNIDVLTVQEAMNVLVILDLNYITTKRTVLVCTYDQCYVIVSLVEYIICRHSAAFCIMYIDTNKWFIYLACFI